MKYSVDLLKKEFEAEKKIDFLFFRGNTPKMPGVVDKSCLSQWFPSPFVVNGIAFPTAEHWMMAQKALLFEDKEAYERILVVENLR